MTKLTTPDGSALSSLMFGTMQFGGKADAAASAQMYDQCRAAGINAFDTASLYTDGASEKLLGASVAKERDAVFVATKAAYDQPATIANLHASADKSRTRMGVDVIDLMYLHRFDDTTDLAVTFEGLADLQAKGVFRFIGVSNFAAWQVMKAQAIAQALGTKIDVIQPMYNLVKRQAEVELLPMCQSEGIAVFPYSPLGGGLLTGKYNAGASGRLTENDQYNRRYGLDWMHSAAGQLPAIAADLGVAPETLAVAWAAKHPGITAPIISGSAPSQLAPSLAAADYQMDDATYAALTALTPTPPPATDRIEEV